MLTGKNISVIGAGIGGLATGLALAQHGARVTIYEQAAALREVGAGIQISPNGTRVLEALGVAPPGLQSKAVVLLDGLSGRRLMQMTLPHGFWLCHRADLIAALASACEHAGVLVKCGHQVDEIDPDSGAFKTTIGQTFRSDLIVGADGLHAISRAAILDASEPQFTGQVAWRATVVGANHSAEARVYTGPGAHVVSYPLRGGQLTNIVAVEERVDWTAESWSLAGKPEDLRAAFSGFAPVVGDLLGGAEHVHKWGLFRRPVASTWCAGTVVLLGDAAHPTLPFLAQGGVMALEDAWVLAESLATLPQSDALIRYQALRHPRVSRAIAAANANAQNYHLRGAQRWAAHKVLRLVNHTAPQLMMRRYSWLYDHDVTRW